MCVTVWPLLLAHIGPPSTTTTAATATAIDANPILANAPPLPSSPSFFIPRDRLALSLHVHFVEGELKAAVPAVTAIAEGATVHWLPLLAVLTHFHAAVCEFVLEPSASVASSLTSDDSALAQLHKVCAPTDLNRCTPQPLSCPSRPC